VAVASEQRPALKSLQSVIFDMDGVIIDSHPAHRKAWKDFLLTMRRDVSAQELDFVLDGRKRHEILRHFLGDISDLELEEYGKKKDQFFQRTSLAIKPQPGVLDFIDGLRQHGITLAVATSAGHSRTSSTLRHLGLDQSFCTVVTGDDVREGKPNPSIYRLACERLNALPEVCLAIEDAESGIRAAKGAGIKCVGFAASGYEKVLQVAGADLVISKFENISLAKLENVLNSDGGQRRGDQLQ
jgi:beta-phosphoglucomutase